MTTPSRDREGGRQLRAWAHPLRLRILSLLTGVPMSAAEVARELATTQANASYHLRHLEAAGLLTVVEEVSVRGGQAKRYRHLPQDVDEAPRPGEPSRPAISEPTWRAVATELTRRAALAGPAVSGAQVLADAELWVSEAEWRAAVREVHEAMRRLHEQAQPPRTPGTVRVSATVALFRMQQETQ